MKRPPAVVHGQGIRNVRGLDRAGWVQLAREAIVDLVETQLAVPHVEVEARLWETVWEQPGTGRRASFFPHILSEALRDLERTGEIQPWSHTTKGSTPVDLIIPGVTERRWTYIERAARRKAMLYARFHRWSKTEFGPAGEAVVRASLQDAQHQGFVPMTPGFGEVLTVGQGRVRGALDSGAWMLVNDPQTNLPIPHALLFEIKNRRLTLYPRHPEVHQLLYKAALLQQANPGQPIVPVLICRRAQKWLFWMAKDLGFIVHDTKRQYLTLPDKTEPRLLDEVRDELGLTDLNLVSATSQPRIIALFTETLPAQARRVAQRWEQIGAPLLDHYNTLRGDKLKPWERTAAITALRTDAGKALDDAGVDDAILAWALEEDVHEEP